MTFNEHKAECNNCQAFNFCDVGLSLLNKKIVEVDTEVIHDPTIRQSVVIPKEPKEVNKFLTKKQRWRAYKKNIKKGSDKVGLSKFKRN